ncbi:AAA family ATPase [Acinetobacter beijerinckii]|uniref:AAA family ATPase n=1 Tax=Acinetobacter beijerinckii TaxID=262668 RepID=UPI0030DB2195
MFIPTRELLTLCPWFISLYEHTYVEFEETWRDTCSLLNAPTIKGARGKSIAELLKPLEEAMGGKVFVDSKSGRFYLSVVGEGNLEMPLVAEGLRKLAMLARLISTGTLLEQGYLFWDEPETNLNPKLIKLIAKVLLHLCQNGIQIFMATHSLFLLREVEILSAEKQFSSIPKKYFALRPTDQGVYLEQGESVDALQTLTLLDEELTQSERFMQIG